MNLSSNGTIACLSIENFEIVPVAPKEIRMICIAFCEKLSANKYNCLKKWLKKRYATNATNWYIQYSMHTITNVLTSLGVLEYQKVS